MEPDGWPQGVHPGSLNRSCGLDYRYQGMRCERMDGCSRLPGASIYDSDETT